jgi:SAM-dependent methyltransferase
MRSWLTPKRRRGAEILDDASTPADMRLRSMRDVERSNRLFGGTRAALDAFEQVMYGISANAVLLDVGTGTADIPELARQRATREGKTLWCVGVDESEVMARAARARLDAVVVADAAALPFGSVSADVVMCSQLLHHFEADDARRVVGELDRVARHAVIVADLRRSWLAVAGFWLASTLLRFHSVTRHDGTTSVLRGFTSDELRDLVRASAGRVAEIRRGLFWRVTACWTPSGAR